MDIIFINSYWGPQSLNVWLLQWTVLLFKGQRVEAAPSVGVESDGVGKLGDE
jgi:hypothetical protein